MFLNYIFIDCIFMRLSLTRGLVCSVMLVKSTELWTSTQVVRMRLGRHHGEGTRTDKEGGYAVGGVS